MASRFLAGARPLVARISTRFPRRATFNIVGPKVPGDVDDRVSNNIEIPPPPHGSSYRTLECINVGEDVSEISESRIPNFLVGLIPRLPGTEIDHEGY